MSIRVLIRDKGQGRSLSLYYLDPFTKREVSKSAGTADKGEAERAAARWEGELAVSVGKDGTGWDYFRRRFTKEQLSTMKKRSKQAYNTALNTFRKIAKVDVISEIGNGTMSQFQAALLEKGYPLTTIATYMGAIKAALNWAAYVGMLRAAPKFRLPIINKKKLNKGRPLTEAEERKMASGCSRFGSQAWEWRRLLELLRLSGFRIGEAEQLSWDSGPVQVFLDAQPYPFVLFHGDGQKSGEDEPWAIPPDFAEWLTKTPRRQRKGPVIQIVGPDGERLGQRTIGQYLCSLGEACGVVVNAKGKHASAHDYRRSFGTRWAKVVKPLTLQKMMRHADLQTTLRYYVSLGADDAGAELWGTVPKIFPNKGQKRKKA